METDFQGNGVAKCVPSLQYAVQAVQGKCGSHGVAALGTLATSVGTVAADQADEDSCTNVYNYFSCSLFSGNATACAGAEMCVFEIDSFGNACSIATDAFTLMSADFVEASKVLSTERSLCAAVTTETACAMNCAWNTLGEECILSASVADALLYAADTPNGIRGFNDVIAVGSSTCSVAVADCPNVTCAVDTDFQQTNASMCVPSLVYAPSTVQAKCGTSGAAALYTLTGIASGAAETAPIAIIVAAVVAAVATFA